MIDASILEAVEHIESLHNRAVHVSTLPFDIHYQSHIGYTAYSDERKFIVKFGKDMLPLLESIRERLLSTPECDHGNGD